MKSMKHLLSTEHAEGFFEDSVQALVISPALFEVSVDRKNSWGTELLQMQLWEVDADFNRKAFQTAAFL